MSDLIFDPSTAPDVKRDPKYNTPVREEGCLIFKSIIWAK